MDSSRTPIHPRRASRAAATVLIVVSVGLQAAAVTRVLCPPRSIAALAALRIGCPPRLWPFIDYPMFSEPHVPGDVLAWIDVRIESKNETRPRRRLYEVKRRTPDEPWDVAYAREEERLRAKLERELGLQGEAAGLHFVRESLVLSKLGLVPLLCDLCPEPVD